MFTAQSPVGCSSTPRVSGTGERSPDSAELFGAVCRSVGRPSRESMTRLISGVCIDIRLGTAFQYRCTGSVPLVFACTALPPWPGDHEAVIMDGPWVPCVDPEPGDGRLD
jgi:hypothetical protein